jgi:nucleotide-binding universal stress UspA family protein
MGSYQQILVAVDGSPSSLHALGEGLRLVPDSLTVISVVPALAGGRPSGADIQPPASGWQPYDRALARAREVAQAAGVPVDAVLAVGEPFERIVALAESRDCELIVLGLKGAELPEGALMGSTTARVIGYSHRDVLVVALDTHLAFGKVLLATDSSRYSQRALARSLELCQSYGGQLTAVAVLDVPPWFAQEAPEVTADLQARLRGYTTAARSQAEARGIRCQEVVRQGPAYQVITALVREQKLDLIVMGSHGRTGLKRLLMGSVTERVIGLSPCPVLVVKT